MNLEEARGHHNYMAGMLMLISAFFIALYGFFSQKSIGITNLGLPLFARFLFGLLMMLPFAFYFKCSLRKNWDAHLARAFFVVSGQYAFFYYLSHATLLKAILLYNTTPLFIPLISYVLYRERISWILGLTILFSFVGVILVLEPGENFSILALIGLIPGLTIACSQLYLYRGTKTKGDVYASIFNLYLWSTLLSLIPTVILYSKQTIVLGMTHAFGLFVLLSILGIGNQVFRSFAYRLVSDPSVVSPHMYMAIVFSGALDWLVYHIVPNVAVICGAILIVGSAVVTMYHPAKPRRL